MVQALINDAYCHLNSMGRLIGVVPWIQKTLHYTGAQLKSIEMEIIFLVLGLMEIVIQLIAHWYLGKRSKKLEVVVDH